MSRTIDATAVPAAALCFAAQAAVEDQDAAGQKVACTITARTADPVNHWYWGRIVHDLEGMTLDAERIPLDYCHDDGEILGYADKFQITPKALTAKGFLVPFSDGDRAAEVIAKSKAGVPYQASIFFGNEGLKLEQVAEGMTSRVNGSLFEGPGVIVRQWSLRGIALCPYGVDPQTSTQFSQRRFAVNLQEIPTMPEPHKLADEKPAAPPVEKPAEETPAAETPAETPAEKPAEETPAAPAAEAPAETPAALAADPHAAARAELKRFSAAFGANGATWFADGKTFAEAQGLYTQKLEADLAEANAKLAAINHGEAKPLSATPEPQPGQSTAQAGLAAKVGPNLARMAAAIKLPGRN